MIRDALSSRKTNERKLAPKHGSDEQVTISFIDYLHPEFGWKFYSIDSNNKMYRYECGWKEDKVGGGGRAEVAQSRGV